MKDLSDTSERQSTQPAETETSVRESRRAALAKMGLYAAYTAPIMLGMMTSAQAQVASGAVTGCQLTNCD